MNRILSIVVLLMVSLSAISSPQPLEKPVRIRIIPNHADWNYRVGEPAVFKIEVYRSGVNLRGVTLNYEYGMETMPPMRSETVTLTDGTLTISAKGAPSAGFFRLRAWVSVDGEITQELCTLAYDRDKIEATATMPDDFNTYWAQAKRDNAAIPQDVKMERYAGYCTEDVDVYHVSFQSHSPGSRVYGWLCVPSKQGRYPAVIHLPGAGVYKHGPDASTAARGFIVLNIGIHRIPLTMEPQVYSTLALGPLSGYQLFGIDNVDRYYYKRVLMGCVSAVSFVAGLPCFDGANIGLKGDSQGGALVLMTAGIDERVTAIAAIHPAFCDHTGYLNARAGGWPHVLKGADVTLPSTQSLMRVLSYYDAVNFARNITAPAFFTMGYNDASCAPTSVFSAYNALKSTDKKCVPFVETGHWCYPSQIKMSTQWLLDKLKSN